MFASASLLTLASGRTMIDGPGALVGSAWSVCDEKRVRRSAILDGDQPHNPPPIPSPVMISPMHTRRVLLDRTRDVGRTAWASVSVIFFGLKANTRTGRAMFLT